MQKRWRLKETETGLSAEAFAQLHPVAVKLFANRGLGTVLEVESFLNPDWATGIHDPFLFSGMRDVVDRVFRALESGEKITVHGDYDADGVTGSTVVITTLREIETLMGKTGTSVDVYIPHRDKEGYGLRRETVLRLKEQGTSLIITVDCGIACVPEIALAKQEGIDTIVLDHHQFGEELPDGLLIHPRLPGESYPFPHLAAVGVSWKFACAIVTEARSRGLAIPEGWEKWLLDLVSIATVTDMVPVVGENRVLLKYGLTVMNKTRRPGLRTLIDIAGRALGEIDSEAIGFSLGPRINAAGRMDHAILALHLMLAKTEDEARTFAITLEDHNRQRQKATTQMVTEAERFIAEHGSSDHPIVVIWNDAWSPSLVGLVAGRFLDRFGKPCVAIGKHDGVWIGSGRSIEGYDITEAVRRAGEGLLTRAGGHPQACGFSFVEDSMAQQFADRLVADASTRLKPEDLEPVLEIDAELGLDDVDWRLVETVDAFEPYGIGNPKPVFMTSGLEVLQAEPIGKDGAHLRCQFRSPSGRMQRFIGFKFGTRAAEFPVGSRVDVVYDVGVNEWNGRRDIQCRLVDIRPTP